VIPQLRMPLWLALWRSHDSPAVALGASPRQVVTTVLKEAGADRHGCGHWTGSQPGDWQSFGKSTVRVSPADSPSYLTVIGVMAVAESFATAEMRGEGRRQPRFNFQPVVNCICDG